MEREDDQFEEEIRDLAEQDQSELPKSEEVQTWGDRMLTTQELSPRHRKLAELAAQGIQQKEIAEKLNYTPGRVSILLTNTLIRQEVERVRERIYEDTIKNRLKALADPSLNVLEKALSDQTNRFKNSEKLDTAKWVIEKLDGKAAQKHDIGDNLLGIVMDKLDALKASGKDVSKMLDVTPTTIEADFVPVESGQTSEKDDLNDWVNQYN